MFHMYKIKCLLVICTMVTFFIVDKQKYIKNRQQSYEHGSKGNKES